MNLIGSWAIDSDDKHAMSELGNVSLEFDENGNLNYIIREDSKDQIMLMTYEVDGDILITDQPSAPRVERTAFSLSAEGVLGTVRIFVCGRAVEHYAAMGLSGFSCVGGRLNITPPWL